jgi:hypothetical protein
MTELLCQPSGILAFLMRAVASITLISSWTALGHDKPSQVIYCLLKKSLRLSYHLLQVVRFGRRNHKGNCAWTILGLPAPAPNGGSSETVTVANPHRAQYALSQSIRLAAGIHAKEAA